MTSRANCSYSGGRAYSQSKLANILFTYQLARRMRGSAVTANALHPGVVRTSFGAEDPARIQRLLVPLLRPVMKSPAQGAATSIHLASAPRTRAGVGPLLRQPATHEILRSQLRPGGRSTALGGERGSGGTHRGTPCLRPPAIARQSRSLGTDGRFCSRRPLQDENPAQAHPGTDRRRSCALPIDRAPGPDGGRVP